MSQLDNKIPATLLIRRSNVQIFVPIPQGQGSIR
jgi:hypothetical protein